MAGRNLGETTVAWLERLLLSGAKEYEINAVREILAAERLPTGKFLSLLAALIIIAHISFTISIVIDDLFTVVFVFIWL
jgi:hypothetical protein